MDPSNHTKLNINPLPSSTPEPVVPAEPRNAAEPQNVTASPADTPTFEAADPTPPTADSSAPTIDTVPQSNPVPPTNLTPLPTLPVDNNENQAVVGVFGDQPATVISPTVTTTQPTVSQPQNPAAASNPQPLFAPDNPAGSAGGLPPVEPKRSRKLPIIAGSLVLLVALLGAGFYFGYYTNSKMAYKQALGNSGEALSEITKELTTESKLKTVGYTGIGDYKVESSLFNTDGKFGFKSDAKNSEITMDIGVAASRLDITARTIASASTNPDIYVKVDGLDGLGELAGPEYGALTTKYDGKWIVIDHTLLDNLQKQATESTAMQQPTAEQIYSALNAFSTVNQEYLFSTEADKAVTVIKQDYGMKTVDGRKVFHYQVGYNKANLKKYIAAQESALKASKMNDWIVANKYEEQVKEAFAEATKSVDEIKDTDTFDMYVDANKRVIYKFRFDEDKNPASNYVDVGLDYDASDELPFFVRGKTEKDGSKGNFDLTVTANAKTKAVSLKLLAEDTGESKFMVTSNFSFKPSSAAVTIEKPADALQLADVMQELGLGDPFGASSELGETLGASTSIFDRQ